MACSRPTRGVRKASRRRQRPMARIQSPFRSKRPSRHRDTGRRSHRCQVASARVCHAQVRQAASSDSCNNAATHGGRGRRGWRKLHLGVDGSRVIVACALTAPTADDAMTGISLVDEVEGHLTRVTADPAYDTRAFYGAAGARGARVVVPPTQTASWSRRGARSGARDRTIRRVKALGRRRWKKASGSHQHARVS